MALSYDPSGDVVQDNLNEYLYDAEGRLCAVESTSIPGMTAMTGYFYDAQGTRVAKGSLTSFSCNFASNGFTPTTSYVAGGPVINSQNPQCPIHPQFYRGRVGHHKPQPAHSTPATMLDRVAPVPAMRPSIITSCPSGYAPNGNILGHTDSVMGTWAFSYDAVDRLVTATAQEDVPAQYAAAKFGCWSYDSYGNRTLEAISTATCANNPTPQALTTYNSTNNRISSSTASPNTVAAGSYVYDASGNTLYDGNNEYWYDAEGQLCAVQSQRIGGAAVIQYVYDAEGARIAKGTLAAAPSTYTATCAPPLGANFTLMARYLVDPGGDQVTELNGLGVWQHSNIWAGGKLTATYDTKGIHFELADPLGTKRVQANALGQIDETCTSLPFGNDVNNPVSANCVPVANSLGTADDATEHHFTQKERDTETGNDYFFARYYNSALGRFTTPDWSARITPVPYMVLNEPQSLNLYSYVGNNPLTHTDPDGHQNCTKKTLTIFLNGKPVYSMSSTICSQGLNHLEENAYRAASEARHLARRGAQGLDWFNEWVGFGKTNCAGGGDCGDALGQALGAGIALFDSDGLSEDANAARVEEEIATLSKKWSKGTFTTLEDSLEHHFSEHGLKPGRAKTLLQYLRQADAFAENLQNSRRAPSAYGATKFMKQYGKEVRFLIKDIEGKIVSYGGIKD
jgi:RHS repeat-associated protein